MFGLQWKEIGHTLLRTGIIRALNGSAGRLLGPPRSTDKTTLTIKVRKRANIRNRYNQAPESSITHFLCVLVFEGSVFHFIKVEFSKIAYIAKLVVYQIC